MTPWCSPLVPLLAQIPMRLAVLGSGDAGLAAHLHELAFEPCGLTQMQAMCYGAIPVVTAVGGLVDTVTDVDLHRSGVGFVAGRAASEDLLAALFRAQRRVRDWRRRATIQKRIMAIDWSWRQPARDYLAPYGELAVNPR